MPLPAPAAPAVRPGAASPEAAAPAVGVGAAVSLFDWWDCCWKASMVIGRFFLLHGYYFRVIYLNLLNITTIIGPSKVNIVREAIDVSY